MHQKLEQIAQESLNPTLWDDPEKAVAIMKEKNSLQLYIDGYKQITKQKQDVEFILESNDPELNQTLDDELTELMKLSKDYYVLCAFSQPCDKMDCFIHIQAGAGGTESEDWASMLLRMYTKFAEKSGYQAELMDFSAGEQPGLVNTATLLIKASQEALFPYGWLKYEHGIHRLVRISPFDASGRRHTSFASVWISPKLNQEVIININQQDLEIRECRASGAGGQHVNKTNSAIQILHKPTGIITQSQQERSQHQNREIAMQLLKSKLYMHEMEQLKKENSKHLMDKTDVSWGHQIRSYTLHPDKRIKDTRTGYESFNTTKTLDGDIKEFILAAIEHEIQHPGSVL